MADQPTKKPRLEIRDSFFGSSIKIGDGYDVRASNNTLSGPDTRWEIGSGSDVDIRGTRIHRQQGERAPGRDTSRVGWRRMAGPPLPVYCENCGTIFPSNKYVYAGSYFNSWDNEEICEKCGYAHAKVSEGLFDLSGEYIRVVSAPEFTYDLIRSLAQVADEYLAHRLTPEAAVSRFELISPRFAELAKKAKKYGLAGLGLVATLVAIDGYRLDREQASLAREQTAIAREALDLQKAAPNPLTKEQLLDALQNYRFTSPDRDLGPALDSEKHQGHASSAKKRAAGNINMTMKRKRINRKTLAGNSYTMHCCCRNRSQ